MGAPRQICCDAPLGMMGDHRRRSLRIGPPPSPRGDAVSPQEAGLLRAERRRPWTRRPSSLLSCQRTSSRYGSPATTEGIVENGRSVVNRVPPAPLISFEAPLSLQKSYWKFRIIISTFPGFFHCSSRFFNVSRLFSMFKGFFHCFPAFFIV